MSADGPPSPSSHHQPSPSVVPSGASVARRMRDHLDSLAIALEVVRFVCRDDPAVAVALRRVGRQFEALVMLVEELDDPTRDGLGG